MKNVSNKYKEEMRIPWRNRWLFDLYVGAIRDEFQATARMQPMSPLSFLSAHFEKFIFTSKTNITRIATFEKDLMRADGTSFFTDEAHTNITDSDYRGYVSEDLSDSTGYIYHKMMFSSTTGEKGLRGLTLTFDQVFPTEFRIVCADKDDNVTFDKTFTNDKMIFISGENFGDQSVKMLILITKMNKPFVRFRLREVLFGVGIKFDNESIICQGNSLVSSFNSCSLQIPTVTLNVSLDNYGNKFDFENPLNFINLYNKDQNVTFTISYQRDDGEIERVFDSNLKLDKFIADNNILRLTAIDFLRNENEPIEFNEPNLFTPDTTLYDIGVMVADSIRDRGFTIVIDESLKSIPVKFNHIKTSRKQALQQIASAGQCVMKFSGKKLYIYQNKNVDKIFTALADDKAPYADMNLVPTKTLTPVATFEPNRVQANGSMGMPGHSPDPNYRTGYISDSLTNELGNFSKDIVIRIDLETASSAEYLFMDFDNNISQINISTYLRDTLVQDTNYEVKGSSIEIYDHFATFDKMVLTVRSIKDKYSRLRLKTLSFKQPYYPLGNDMYLGQQPKSITQEKVKNIVVVYTTATKNGDTFTTVKNSITIPCNETGRDIKYENPFVTTLENAQAVGEWLKKYYANNLAYNISFVGDPALETNDILKLDNKYNNDLLCIVEKNEIVFTNGGVNGKIEARRL